MDTIFRPIAIVLTNGNRTTADANTTAIGFRPSLELNRFTINSINHNHYDNTSRRALTDENNTAWHYWTRSAGLGSTWPVTVISTAGVRTATAADGTNFGIRPIL